MEEIGSLLRQSLPELEILFRERFSRKGISLKKKIMITFAVTSLLFIFITAMNIGIYYLILSMTHEPQMKFSNIVWMSLAFSFFPLLMADWEVCRFVFSRIKMSQSLQHAFPIPFNV